MKLKGLIATAAMSLLMGVGVFAGAVVFANSGDTKTMKVEALSASSYTKIPSSDGCFYYRAYFGDDGWTKDNAKIWCEFKDGSNHSCWTSACINTDDNLIYYDSSTNSSYYVVVPSNTNYTWTKAKLYRYDSGSSTSRGTKWNETSDITFGSSFNCAGPTNYGASYTVEKYNVNYFEAGATYYLDLSVGNYGWNSGNYKIYGHLWTGNAKSSSTDVQLTQVLGFSNNYLYQLVIPSNCSYFRLIFHKGTSSSDYNKQTGTLYRDTSKGVFKLTSDNGAGSWDWNLSNADRANYYGKYFIAQITCGGTTGPNAGTITAASGAWDNVKNEYSRLSSTIQGLVYVSSGSESGTDLQKAMYRYDYIVFYKKEVASGYSSYDDFISRDDSPGLTSFAVAGMIRFSKETSQDATSSTLVAITASIIAVATAAGFIFLKKKKSLM